MKKDLEYYMGLVYLILFEPYKGESGAQMYGLSCPELPGVWAEGFTINLAYNRLARAKKLWFATRMERGWSIPEPQASSEPQASFSETLFSKSVRIGDDRSVSVEEMPFDGIVIKGTKLVEDPPQLITDVKIRNIMFSKAAAIALSAILTDWIDHHTKNNASHI